MITHRDAAVYDVAFDLIDLIDRVSDLADHTDTTPEEKNKLSHVWKKLKGASEDLNGLLPAPISIPQHQSQ